MAAYALDAGDGVVGQPGAGTGQQVVSTSALVDVTRDGVDVVLVHQVGPVSTGRPLPRTFPLILYSHSESTAP